MIKIIWDNNVIDSIGVAYTKTEIELVRTHLNESIFEEI